MAKIVVGMTGASGSLYATRLMRHLKALNHTVEFVCTDAGKKVAYYEKSAECFDLADKVYSNEDYFAPIASGSYTYDGLVILPCSMGTLGKIASGVADNLLCRAADVRLKERRRLIIVPREMPFSGLHLQNMARLAEWGACILPACPHFYHHPQNIEDLVDTVLARVLDQLELEHSIGERWGENT